MRFIDVAWRLAVVAAAIALSFVVITLVEPVPLIVALVAALLLAGGAIVNRAWVAGVPFGAAALYALWVFIHEGMTLNDEGGDTTWGLGLVILALFATLAAAGLALGVGLRRAIDAATERRRGGGHREPRRTLVTR